MNELLGGLDADGIESLADLPKAEAGEHERALRTFSRPSPKERVRRRKTNSRRTLLPKPVGATYI